MHVYMYWQNFRFLQVTGQFSLYFNMNYIAQMLRDYSKGKSIPFNELCFPIVQQIEFKIRNKNLNLRKKIKQRLLDRQKIPKSDERRQEINAIGKKDSNSQKAQREAISYIQAYEDQRSYQHSKRSHISLDEIRLDSQQNDIASNIYILIRKKKCIFKIEQVKRKMRNKQNLKRMSLRQCQCCQRVGKHKCSHKFCEGKCLKNAKEDKIQNNGTDPEQIGEDLYAIEVAQQLLDSCKKEEAELNIVRIVQKEEEAISIPKIDITEKQEELIKDEQQDEILNQRQRISQNQSKSNISQSKKNKANELNQQNDHEVNQQSDHFDHLDHQIHEPIEESQKRADS